MKTSDITRINDTRREMLRQRDASRISEVARVATNLQRQGLTRTEALKRAEELVPR